MRWFSVAAVVLLGIVAYAEEKTTILHTFAKGDAGKLPKGWTAAKTGEQKGLHWIIGPQKYGGRAIRWVRIDTNFWKSFVVARLRQAVGEHGALSFFGRSRAEIQHDMLADHLTCEVGIEVEAAGRKITEWTAPPNAQNHWLDSVVGCAVAASLEGCVLPGQPSTASRFQAEIAASNRRRGRSTISAF